MSKQPSITSQTSRYEYAVLNANLESLQEGFNNTLSLDGSTPNAMQADLDMNSNDLLNVGIVNAATVKINGVAIEATDSFTSDRTDIKYEFATVAQLLAFDNDGYFTVGDYVKAGGFLYRVVSSGEDVTTAGGDKLTVLKSLDGYYEANAFGSTNAAWQLAVAKGGKVRFAGSYTITTALSITSDITLDLEKATFTAAGSAAAIDAFTCNDAAVSIVSRGGAFTEARWGFAIRKALNVDIEGASFDDVAVGIGVNVITNSTFTSAGKFSVRNCKFNDCEIGASVQSCQFAVVEFQDNFCTNIGDKSVASRVYPLDKKIVAGFWYQSTSGDTVAIVTGNYASGVTEPGTPGAEPEVHGFGVTLDDASETDVIMANNHVRDLEGTSIEGCEGLMGRGKRVVINGNTLYNAGFREGSIYAKGSGLHKITNNLLEISSGYSGAATARGVISTGTNCDISGNKFIGFSSGIYTRALVSRYQGNEFIGCNSAFTLALTAATVHIKTEILGNYADEDTPNFFTDGTAGSETYGDFLIAGNWFYGSQRFASMKGAVSLVIADNFIRRAATASTRELLSINGVCSLISFKRNEVLAFQNNVPDGRILTGNTTNTPRIMITENQIEGGSTAFWLRDQTYVDLVIRNNQFFNCTPRNVTSITVSGKNVTEGNVGIDL